MPIRRRCLIGSWPLAAACGVALLLAASAPALAQVLATPGMLPFVKDGTMTALPVTSKRRSALAPAVPRVGEAGYEALEQEVLDVAMVPAATPEPVVKVLQPAIADALPAPTRSSA